MQSHNRNYLISTVALILSFFAVFNINKANSSAFTPKDSKEFPLTIGQWQGRDLEISEDIYEALATKDVIVREYKDEAGSAVTLLIVYSQNNRASFHPPELCYLGGGVELLGKDVEEVSLDDSIMKTSTLTMKDRTGVMKAWYWFASKNSFTHNYYLQQVNILVDWIRYRTKEGALIRVSTRLPKGNAKVIENKVKEFIKELKPVVENFIQKKA